MRKFNILILWLQITKKKIYIYIYCLLYFFMIVKFDNYICYFSIEIVCNFLCIWTIYSTFSKKKKKLYILVFLDIYYDFFLFVNGKIYSNTYIHIYIYWRKKWCAKILWNDVEMLWAKILINGLNSWDVLAFDIYFDCVFVYNFSYFSLIFIYFFYYS